MVLLKSAQQDHHHDDYKTNYFVIFCTELNSNHTNSLIPITKHTANYTSAVTNNLYIYTVCDQT